MDYDSLPSEQTTVTHPLFTSTPHDSASSAEIFLTVDIVESDVFL